MIAGELEIRLLADVARIKRDMDQVSRHVGTSMDKVERAARIATRALGALGVGVSVGALANLTKQAINAQDELAKMSQRIGVSVTSLAGLTHAASLSGASTEQLGVGLRQLAKNMNDMKNGTGEARVAFETLNLSVTDSRGRLKDSEAMMIEIANKFASMQDGAEKTALAMRIFGESGSQLIPMLNAGSAGLAAMTDEGRRYNPVTEESAKQAERFNDNLTRLSGATRSTGRALVNELLPSLESASMWLLRLVDETAWFEQKLRSLRMETGEMARQNIQAALTEEVELVIELGERMRNLESLRANSPQAEENYRRLAEESAEATERVRRLHQALEDLKRGGTDPAAESAAAAAAANDEFAVTTSELRGNLPRVTWNVEAMAAALDMTAEELAAVAREAKGAEDGIDGVGNRSHEVSEAMIRDWQNVRQSFGEFFADLVLEGGNAFDALLKSWERTALQMAGNSLFDVGARALGINVPGGAGGSAGSAFLSAGGSALGSALVAGPGSFSLSALGGTTGGWVAPSMLAPSGGAAAGAGGLSGALGAIPGWGWALLAAGGLAAAFSKKKTPSFNAGMLLHGLPGIDGQFSVDPFASGLRPVGFSRRSDDAESRQVIDTFRTLDASIVELASKLGLTISANRNTFTGLDERGMGSGLFFGAAGEKGKPGMALERQLEMYAKQLIASLSGQIAQEDLDKVLAAGGVDKMIGALEDLFKAQEKVAKEAEETAKKLDEDFSRALGGIRSIIDPIENGIRSLADALRNDLGSLMGLAGGMSITDQISRLSDLRDQAWDNHREQLRAEEELHNTRLRLAESMGQFATSLRLGDLSPLSRSAKFDLAAQDFRGTLAATLSGDVNAAGRLQGTAQAFAEQSQGMFASSSRHKDIMAEILAGLDQASGMLGASQFDPQQANNRLVEELQRINAQLEMLPGKLGTELAGPMGAFIQAAMAAGVPNENIANIVRGLGPSATAGADAAMPGFVSGNATPNETIIDAINRIIANSGTQLEALTRIREEAVERDLSSAYIGQIMGLSPAQMKKNLQVLEAAGIPGFRDGGIVSGPMSGYPVILHGTEKITPMNGPAANDAPWQEVLGLLRDIVGGLRANSNVEKEKLDKIAVKLDGIQQNTRRPGEGGAKFGNAA